MIMGAITEKRTLVSNVLRSDAQAALGRMHADSGIRSLAILPLIVSDEAVGVLSLCASEDEFFHEEELKLRAGLAGDIAFAIDHIDKRERLDYLAYYDSLTGLANQSLFLERLQQKLPSGRNDPRKEAVFVLDIERFKSINDAFSRQAGDELLKQVAQRRVEIGGGDASRFARIGGDRFAVFASGMENAEHVGRVAEQKLSASFRAAFRVKGNNVRVSATDADTLLRNAEAALKKAKGTGERYLFFAPGMTERIQERLSLENRLQQALDQEEFVLHYQPKVSSRSPKAWSWRT
jgi:diguanylate cyclase (GGDEF)-like protein